jgi:hypothetical protein
MSCFTARRAPLIREPHTFRFPLGPEVLSALSRLAAGEFRSTNVQIELVLRRAIIDEGLLPLVRPLRRSAPPARTQVW